MKATWIGEDGGPDAVTVHGITFPAGKAVDVPEEIGVGRLLGNPFFKLSDTPSDRKAAAEGEVASAQAELDKAKATRAAAKTDDDKKAAERSVNDAQTALDAANGRLKAA